MANRLMKRDMGTLEQGIVKLYGSATTTTSGTIGSATGKGLTITKTATKTGRYTVTLADKYTALLAVSVTIAGTTDAAYTTAKGLTHIIRNVNVGAATPYFEIQFNDPDGSAADAELESAAVFYVEVTLKNSSAY